MEQSSILEKLKSKRPTLSFEMFPPKTEEGARQFVKTAHLLKNFNFDFVSLTYGAGGSTRRLTVEYAEILSSIFNYTVMPHLTCIGHTKLEIETLLLEFEKKGFRNIMALRGDIPLNGNLNRSDFLYASDLVTLIKEKHKNFWLGVGGYPEIHPQSKFPKEDIVHLKIKVDAGASFITTQLFLDNKDYFSFVKNCRNAGINVPIIAGIIIPSSLTQLEKFTLISKAKIPQKLRENFEKTSTNEENLQVGIDWVLNQISELMVHNVDGLHFFILNNTTSILPILNRLRL